MPEKKQKHNRYTQKNADIDLVNSNRWLKTAGLKAEIEGFIMAAQDQNVPTRNYQARIMWNESNLICRLYKQKIE